MAQVSTLTSEQRTSNAYRSLCLSGILPDGVLLTIHVNDVRSSGSMCFTYANLSIFART